MARKKHNIHYIYKTTCNITGRWYVGMHSTSNIDDGYMGSGKILRHSIRQHGVKNHTKEILEFALTREDLVLREIEIVNSSLITEPKCMNIKEGGCGGFINDEHMINFLKAGRKAFKEKLNNDEEFRNNFSLKKSENTKKAILEGRIKTWKELYDWTGKKHSEETKELISEIKKGTGTGDTNSQYGTCWITKDGVNKKIKKENINDYLLDNWVKGRFTELKGELVNNSKLTNDDVIKIKELLADGELTQVKIANLFNVQPETISKIKRKLIWK